MLFNSGSGASFLEEIKMSLQTIEKKSFDQRTVLPMTGNMDYEIIHRSFKMKDVIDKLDKIAATPATVLITGESGTGKELAARRIHQGSPCSGPFLAINLGGVPETLVESELFGYEKGAFTGAAARKEGLLESADGGTLFLDEIGEICPALQVKLLRVLQEKTLRRLGGLQDIPINARIITATNCDIEEQVSNGLFREDLYYRLNVAQIHLPALRERPDDIPCLTEHIIQKLNLKFKRNLEGVSPEVLEQLQSHSFPGNIRELENILENAFIFTEGPLINSIDTSRLNTPLTPLPPRGTLKELESKAILRTLQKWGGNQTKAAEELGITRRTIFSKIREFGYKDFI